jgi:8-oxo-dGTP pyrophosphatase MutT (NUDIX family)
MKNPDALTEAQSASEMFDVMEPPREDDDGVICGFDIFTMKGVPTGATKARGLVHQDRDWHRSVHVWLIDRDKQVVALQKRSPNKVPCHTPRLRFSECIIFLTKRKAELTIPLPLLPHHVPSPVRRQDTFPNRWDISAAGHIESGQDSVDTAVRELAEELGVATTRDELEFAFTVPARHL